MKRQQRKLNFLITQTELYAHFMARKMTGETNSDKQAILRRLEEKPSVSSQGIPDDYGNFRLSIGIIQFGKHFPTCINLSSGQRP